MIYQTEDTIFRVELIRTNGGPRFVTHRKPTETPTRFGFFIPWIPVYSGNGQCFFKTAREARKVLVAYAPQLEGVV